jgi:hypothetical protein
VCEISRRGSTATFRRMRKRKHHEGNGWKKSLGIMGHIKTDFEETGSEDVGSIMSLGYVTLAGSREDCNERLASVKCGRFRC